MSEGVSLPEMIGPYRISGVLGRGGMGVVYRGVDRETGVTAAIKTVAGEHSFLAASLRREIRALQRLDHGGVARILGEGVADGVPWYAMELLTGQTLRKSMNAQWADGALDDAPTAPSPLTAFRARTTNARGDHAPQSAPPMVLAAAASQPRTRTTSMAPVLTLVRRLCGGLAYVHGSNIVHRDLKPDNVFVRSDGTPVIVDFGVAGHFAGARAREEVDRAGEVLGSYAYMAPEQIRGELVDARADLYALGCILYEVITGEQSLASESAPVVMHRQLFDRPMPPSRRAAIEVPPLLDELVLGLLEKQPAMRPGYAVDVAATLTTVLRDLGVPAEHEAGEAATAPAYLYRPTLAGREGMVNELSDGLQRSLARRHGRCVFVAGESGVGKTRLVLEVSRSAAQGGAEVIASACPPRDRAGDRPEAAPLAALRPLLVALADRCREIGERGVELVLGEHAAVLAPYEPALAALVPLSTASQLSPRAAQARLHRALRAALAALAGTHPVLLVIDDLQWADELSLGFLAMLADDGLDGIAAAVIGTWRVDEVGAELPALTRSPSTTVIRLDRLDREAAATMACGMLAVRALPPWFVSALHDRSGGNPFFLAEYLRASIDHGLLRRTGEGRWHLDELRATTADDLPAPTTLLEVVRRRLDLLDPRGRAMAELAAVFGREVAIDVLLAAGGDDEAAAIDAIETLRARAVLDDVGRGRVRFAHDSIREAAYAAIPDDTARTLHLRAGTALEASASPESPTADPLIAAHFARALMHDKAAAYYERAGDRAATLHANREAIAFYRAAADEHARGVGDRDDLAAALGEKLGDVLALCGRHDEARVAYQGALEQRRAEGTVIDRARLWRRIGATWQADHRWDQAIAAFERAEAALPATPAIGQGALWEEWVDVRVEHVDVLANAGRGEQLAALVDWVTPAVERHAGAAQRGRFSYALALIEAQRERYVPSDATLATMRRALVAANESDDRGLRLRACFGLASMHLVRDELEAAHGDLVKALAESVEHGDVPMETRCLTYLTILHRRRGEIATARDHARRAARAAHDSGLGLYVGAAYANLAWLAWRDHGASAEVEQLGRAALEQWREHGAVFPFEWLGRLPLVATALARGDVAGAVETAAPLTDETQQRLAAAVEQLLVEAAAAWRAENRDQASRALSGCLDQASQRGYL